MKSRVLRALFATCLLLPLNPAMLPAAPAALIFQLIPDFDVPLGSSGDYFRLGGGASFNGSYRLALSFPLLLRAELGYSLHPLEFAVPKTLHLLYAGAGLGSEWEFVRRLVLDAQATGGYYYGLTRGEDGSSIGGGNLFMRAGGGLSYRILPSLSVGIHAAYQNFLGKPQSLLQGLALSLGVSYRVLLGGGEELFEPPAPKPSLLELTQVRFDDIFPVFYQYYDTHPIGKATLSNKEKADLQDLKLSLFVKQYMDNPKVTTLAGTLKSGESREVELSALFNDRVLEITEGTKVSAEIQVEYTLKGSARKGQFLETMKLNNRNASVWDDDRRAAAFVTARDPAVLRFSKGIAGLVRNQVNQAVDLNLRTAMALHQALGLYGVSYVVDPKTPYAEFVQKKLEIDFLQFPRQTLQYRAGDCDDLSILCSALLESVSIDTAFITVPGHIYIAFVLQMSPGKVKEFFQRPEDLILRGGEVWIPLEVTRLQGGFNQAWSEGAKTWREYSASGAAGFYPLRDAWQIFEPVGLPGEAEGIASAPETVEKSYLAEFDRFLHKEMDERIASCQKEIQQTKTSPKSVNRLGVLYARFGLLDQAEKEFRRAIAKEEYLPAMINLGNVLYLRPNLKEALSFFTRADKKAPQNPAVLLNLARINHELELYDKVKQSYEALARVAPELAEQNKYLALRGDKAARAAEAQALKGEMLWQE